MVGLILSACSPNTVTQGLPSLTATTDLSANSGPAAAAAQNALANQLGIAPIQVLITSAEPVDWPDACLGEPATSEMCAQIVTPGYRIKLTANNQVYTFNTNLDGSSLRQAAQSLPGQINQTPTSQMAGGIVSPTEASAAVDAVVKALAVELKMEATTIKLTSVEAVDWPDGCMGAGKPNAMCLQVITPGYRIILDANNKSYEYHTDLTGKIVILVQGPQHGMGP